MLGGPAGHLDLQVWIPQLEASSDSPPCSPGRQLSQTDHTCQCSSCLNPFLILFLFLLFFTFLSCSFLSSVLLSSVFRFLLIISSSISYFSLFFPLYYTSDVFLVQFHPLCCSVVSPPALGRALSPEAPPCVLLVLPRSSRECVNTKVVNGLPLNSVSEQVILYKNKTTFPKVEINFFIYK